MGTSDDVVIVPTSELGDFLLTDRTDAVLFFPKMEQLAALPEVIDHFDAEAFFKIELPGGVIGVGLSFDFGVPADRRVGGIIQAHSFSIQFTIEHPVTLTLGAEVFVPDPMAVFVGVSTFGPLPKGLEDSMVRFDKGLFTVDVLMIIGPASEFGVEERYQLSSRGLGMGMNDVSDVG